MVAKGDASNHAAAVVEDVSASEEELRYRPDGDVSMERDCMTCGRTFVSEGWHNRMCPRCRKRGDAVG